MKFIHIKNAGIVKSKMNWIQFFPLLHKYLESIRMICAYVVVFSSALVHINNVIYIHIIICVAHVFLLECVMCMDQNADDF